MPKSKVVRTYYMCRGRIDEGCKLDGRAECCGSLSALINGSRFYWSGFEVRSRSESFRVSRGVRGLRSVEYLRVMRKKGRA